MKLAVKILTQLLALLFLSNFVLAQGKSLPKVKLKDMENQYQSLEKLAAGKVTLINFWATYCVPCRKEMGYLKKIHQTYSGENAQIIGISIDDGRTMGRVKSLVRSQKLNYTILMDPDQKLYKSFNTSSLPFSILLDTQGDIVWEHTGYVPGDESIMELEIQKVLKQSKKD